MISPVFVYGLDDDALLKICECENDVLGLILGLMAQSVSAADDEPHKKHNQEVSKTVKIDGKEYSAVKPNVKNKKYPKIEITTDGKITTAKMIKDNKVVKEAKSTCCPEDSFILSYGAELALCRLFLKKQKYYE